MTTPATTARRVLSVAALACAAGLLAACGSSGSAAGSGSTVTVTATPHASGSSSSDGSSGGSGGSSGGGAAPCTTSNLQVDVGKGNGAAGSVVVPLQFSNTGGSNCTLYGYPGVSFVTGVGGSQIGASAGEDPASPRQQVTIAPGSSAHALLQVAVAQNFPAAKCQMVTAHWLKVYPPGQTTALYLDYTSATCSNPSKAVRTLMVQTLQPGAGGS